MKKLLTALSLLGATAVAGAATLNHQYRLDGSLADDLAGPELLSSGGTLDATGYSFGENQGLTLKANLGASYSIDLLFHFDSATSGWNKIIDYTSLSSDSGMYTLNGTWNYCCGSGTSGNFSSVQAGVDARLTVTRTAAGAVSLYVDGVLGASISNDNGIGDFAGNDANFFIDDVVTSQIESHAGRVDFIRTFNGVLSANEVAALGNSPSLVTSPVPEPGSLGLILLGVAGVATASRRRLA